MKLIQAIGLLTFAFWLSATHAHAYKQADTKRITAPKGGFEYLRGYNSRTGEYVEKCLKPVNQITEGRNAPAQGVYKYQRSVHDAMSVKDVDVKASIDVSIGLGGAKVSQEVNYFRENKSFFDHGAAQLYFSDMGVEKFVKSSASFRLNDVGKSALNKQQNGRINAFRKTCGDYIVIGRVTSRWMHGLGSFKHKKSWSQKKIDSKTQLAIRYMRAQVKGDVSVSTAESNEAENLNIEIRYLMSGDPEIKGATNLKELAELYTRFSELPTSQTQVLTDIYIIKPEDLLPKSEFDVDLPREQLSKLEVINNGLVMMDRAVNEARLQRNRLEKNTPAYAKAATAFIALRRDYWSLIGTMRQTKGCYAKFPVLCDNLYRRFLDYPKSASQNKVRDFVETTTRRNEGTCDVGYTITAPSGRSYCKRCAPGKQPSFRKGNGGECAYLPKKPKSDNLARVWMHETASSGSGIDAPTRYRDFCLKPGRKCGKPAANRLCKDKGYSQGAADFQKWVAPLKNMGLQRTRYPDGKNCNVNSDDFVAETCQTFKYVDCVKG